MSLLLGMVMVPTLLDFSIQAWRREPETRIEDAYKWLFQATRGGEHMVQDDTGPRRWLEREWAGLGPAAREPASTALDPAGRLVRLHLRPYKQAGGDPAMLLAMFVASARGFESDPARFRTAWRALGDRLAQGRIGHLNRAEWERLDRSERRFGYGAVHHSIAYTRAYRPAYRIVRREMLVP
jgi:hypothetical protein